MSSGLKKAAVVLAVVLVGAQLVRPDRTNPPTDPSRTIQAQAGTSSQLGTILGRACGDCHSNDTVWPWYTGIAPVSWLMALGVKRGREAVNFSEWANYPPGMQQSLLALSCQDVRDGKMPGPYTLVRPETALSETDIETVCAATHPADAAASRRR
jgi:hypothetical protein